jgi:hypothetical protein
MEVVKPANWSPNDAAAADPFDLSNIRLSQDFTEAAGVKKLLISVPVRKPTKQEFVRVHPSEAYRTGARLFVQEEDREVYLVGQPMVGELSEAKPYSLFTAINRQGVVFLWPVRLPEKEAKDIEWHWSLREAAAKAVDTWLRVKANMGLGAYEITVAEGIITDPVWPEASFQDLIRIGFRDRLINDPTHAAVRRLRGLS